MSRRARRLTVALAVVVALLFTGRWAAGLLADRWWAAEISPAAVRFLTDWHVLRLTLDLGGFLVASAWFVGHMLLVYRAVGSVQVRRHVANLEIREALRPGALLGAAVAAGLLMGLLVGGGSSSRWEEVALGWQGVTYGVSEPLLGRDLGLYVAQLPLWRTAHAFLLLLVVVGLGVVFLLYLLVGAVRWLEGRPAINDHARRHLGWLLGAFCLALAWGYLLEPFEAVAGLSGPFDPGAWRALSVTAWVLAGVALATGFLSVAWAARPRHALVAAGWIVLAMASIVGHWVLPPAVSRGVGGAAAGPVLGRADAIAYGLEERTERSFQSRGAPSAPAVPSLWSVPLVARAVGADSTQPVTANQAVLSVQGKPRAAWLALRPGAGGRLSLYALADDHLAPHGAPLFYRPGDSLARTGAEPMLELAEGAIHPNAPALRFGETGVRVDRWGRRLVLAWALQAGSLLGDLPPGERIDWHLSPAERLGRLAPFAEWDAPVARLIDGDLVWLLDGYLSSATFPLSRRLGWHGRRVGYVRAAFLALVTARNGATRIFLRPGADTLAEAWAEAAGGMVEPASAIPEPVLRAAPYPIELLRAQAQAVLAVASRVPADRRAPIAESSPPTELVWAADTSGLLSVAALEIPGARRIDALLIGSREEGRDMAEVVGLDSAATLPSRTVLEYRWSRFPSFDAFTDSVRENGGRLERGLVRYQLSTAGLVGYQPYYAGDSARGPAVVWVSVAAGQRLGAGRDLPDAWSNLLGTTGPSLIGGPARQVDRLEEARRWLVRADSALRAGDWAAFGRAWSGLRGVLGVAGGSAR